MSGERDFMDEIRPKLRVFLVEDDLVDAERVKRSLAKSGIPHVLTVFTTGEEMLGLLKASQEKAAPNLLILDLNLPGEHGFEILKKMKEDPSLESIPVIILSASDRKEDMVTAYKQGSVFMKKSWDEKMLKEVIQQMKIAGILKF